MSLQVLCPTCGQITEFHRPPARECAQCGATLPATVQATADLALKREHSPKPALLVVGQILSGFAGTLFVLLTLTAPFDWGTYHVNGEAMSGPDFLRNGGWLMGVLGGMLVAIAIGL